MAEPVLYRDEVWTGTEYQVASGLLHEGLIREGLSIIRGIDDRYDGRRHNPWNEVECGDHYSRAMASWGCLIALAGSFTTARPAGSVSPRAGRPTISRPFSRRPQVWGSLRQTREAGSQTNGIDVKHGTVTTARAGLRACPKRPSAAVRLELKGPSPRHRSRQTGDRVKSPWQNRSKSGRESP